jgi:hypothetical protein
MTVQEKIRRFEKLTNEKLRMLGIGAVHLHEQQVVDDSKFANHPNIFTSRDTPSAGVTFNDNNIVGTERYSDWDHSGEFHDKLRFTTNTDIAFTSDGEGYESIKENYPKEDWIAPTAKVLSESTITAIEKDFINNVNNEL